MSPSAPALSQSESNIVRCGPQLKTKLACQAKCQGLNVTLYETLLGQVMANRSTWLSITDRGADTVNVTSDID